MACKDFSDVKKGEFGGLIESEKNLSHDGDCWVSKNAMVYDDAMVYDNAYVWSHAKVYDRAKVYNDAWVHRGA
jgi:UDP-3-O-[3-hydroxymyristoyl] glucosamine N-acyltransferase